MDNSDAWREKLKFSSDIKTNERIRGRLPDDYN